MLESTATAPTEVGSLTYTGVPQALVTKGNTSCGTLQYSLAKDGEFSTEIPTATDAGTYSVYYKVVGEGEYADKDDFEPVSVTIGKADYSDSEKKQATGNILAGTASSNVEIALPEIPEHMDYGTPNLGETTSITEASVSNGKLVYTSDNSAEKGSSYTITIPVVQKDGESANYNSYDITVTLTGIECEHGRKESVAEVPATCTEDGVKAHDECTVCGAKFNGEDPATDEELKIQKLGHDWKYSANGASLIASCSRKESCKQEDANLTLVPTNPTYSAEGETIGWNYKESVAFTLTGESDWESKVGDDSVPTVMFVGTGNTTYEKSETEPTDAGTYKAIITKDTATAEMLFEIKKIDRTGVTVSMSDYNYNGTPGIPTVSGNGSGEDEATVTYYYNTTNSNKDGIEWKDITGTTLDTDTYYMYAVLSETKNYKKCVTAPVAFTVTGSELGEVTATGVTKNYDGNSYGITVSCDTEDTTVSYGTTDGTYNLESSPEFKDAGTYTVYYKVTRKGFTPETGSATVTINKKSVKATVTAENKVYDGTTTAIVNATVSDGLIKGDSITITGLTGTFSDANVGEGKKVTVSDENKSISGEGRGNYDIAIPTSTTANITKAEPTLTVKPSLNPSTPVIKDGSAEDLINQGSANGGTVQYQVDSMTEEGWLNTVPKESESISIGTHKVYYKIKGDSNHNDKEDPNWYVEVIVDSGKVTVDNSVDSSIKNSVDGAEATGASCSNLADIAVDNREEGKEVTISLDAKVKAEANVEEATKDALISKVENAFPGIESANVTKEFLDIQIKKQVASDDETTISETGTPLEICIQYSDLSGKSPLIFRYHGTSATVFNKLATRPTSDYKDGTFYVAGNYIYLYSKYYSDYVIAYASGHTVTFNSNGGSEVTPIVVANGGTIATLPTPSKSGYKFGGWYSDAGLTTPFTTDTTVTADVTLYAKWTTASSGGSSGGGSGSIGGGSTSNVKPVNGNTTSTGVLKGTDGSWYFFKNGVVDENYNDVAQNPYGWWVVRNGKVDFAYQGIASNPYGDWYCEKGKVNFNANGVLQSTAKESSGWYFVKGGKVQKGKETVEHNANGWWYIGKDGKVDFNKDTVAKNVNGWWVIQKGKVNFNFKGIATNPYGDWYCEKGKVNFAANGVLQSTNDKFNGWYFVKNGCMQKGKETVERNAYGWWYIGKDGKVDFKMNTVAQNVNGWWIIQNGKVNFAYKGIASNQYGTWYIEGGKVNFKYNGKYKDASGKEYTIKNGKVMN